MNLPSPPAPKTSAPSMHVPAWILLALKVAVVAVALGLEYSGHLTGNTATILTALVAALGLRGAVQAFAPPAQQDDPAAVFERLMGSLVPLLPSLFPRVMPAPAGAGDASPCPDCGGQHRQDFPAAPVSPAAADTPPPPPPPSSPRPVGGAS